MKNDFLKRTIFDDSLAVKESFPWAHRWF